MEGSRFIPPDQPAHQVCPECGQEFQPRDVGEGLDELCDTCYDAQFEPLNLPKWQKAQRRPRAPRLPAVARPRRAHGAGVIH